VTFDRERESGKYIVVFDPLELASSFRRSMEKMVPHADIDVDVRRAICLPAFAL
jgi:hypothetical protein